MKNMIGLIVVAVACGASYAPIGHAVAAAIQCLADAVGVGH